MKGYQKELAQIKEILKDNPRGLTVKEIAEAIKVNRNSVAKYLDVLLISGRVDMKLVGPAKLFFQSQRVPLSALLNFSSDGIVTLDTDAKILQINDQFIESMNLKTEKADLIGKLLKELKTPICAIDGMKEKIREAIDGKEILTVFSCDKNGEKKFFRTKLIPTTFDDGDQGVTIILEDITDQKKVDLAIQQSEERYRQVIENIGEGIGIVDINETFILCNQAAEEIFGVPTGELVGRNLKEFVNPEMFKELQNQTEIRKTGKKSIYELNILCYNKERKQILVTATPQYDRENKFIGTFGSFRDITERKRRTKALQDQEAQQRALIEAIPDLLFRLNKNGIFLSYEAGHDKDLYVPPDLFLGKSVEEVLPTIMVKQTKEAIKKALKTKKTQVFDYQLPIKNELRDFEARLTNIKDEEFLVIARDISEQKKAAIAQKKSEERFKLQFMNFPLPAYFWQKNDKDFILIDYNYAAETITDGRIKDILYITVNELYSDKPEVIEDMNECFTTKKNITRDILDYKFKTTGRKAKMRVYYSYVPLDIVVVYTEVLS